MATQRAHQPGGTDTPCACTPPNPSNAIPMFSPCTPHHGACPPTPNSESDDNTTISLDSLPKGHLLVVQGCLTSNPAGTPVSLVQDAITNIKTSNSISYFISPAIEVKLLEDGEPEVNHLEMLKVNWRELNQTGKYTGVHAKRGKL
ncbi:hypothetical protein BDZ94DRAFT_1313964 [Collybia nuda]|uniref:Uncharacterized protein n=1 Tax=Collybia nuda TaxID=64659 RepID=A0A9P5XVQ0_9AGAR|nr:hypothetical protein BDZ94DRAFT_1313964 [Collybia nuda]